MCNSSFSFPLTKELFIDQVFIFKKIFSNLILLSVYVTVLWLENYQVSHRAVKRRYIIGFGVCCQGLKKVGRIGEEEEIFRW